MYEQENMCKIPCNSMPIVLEADYGVVVNPYAHCDRVASFNVLIYVLKGSMEIIEAGKIYSLSAGSLFFLKSGIHHWGEKPFAQGTAWYYIHFTAPEPDCDARAYTKDLGFKSKVYRNVDDYSTYIEIPKLLKLPEENQLRVKIKRLIDLHNSGDMVRTGIMMWKILYDCSENPISDGGSKHSSLVSSVISFLNQNYKRNFTSSEFAKHIGFSYKYIGTIFKDKTGHTIKDYQIMLRVTQGERLLIETEKTVSEIASEIGYYDAFYFSKVFKQAKGVSPTAYRKNYIPKI